MARFNGENVAVEETPYPAQRPLGDGLPSETNSRAERYSVLDLEPSQAGAQKS